SSDVCSSDLRSEKSRSMEDDFRRIQQVDAEAIRRIAQGTEHVIQACPIELVITRHVDYGRRWKVPAHPFQPAESDVDVAGEHHHVRLHERWSPFAELQMQVRVYANPGHCLILACRRR